MKNQDHIESKNQEATALQNDEFCLFYDTGDSQTSTLLPKVKRKLKDRHLMAVENEKYSKALRYGFHILPEVKDFLTFCTAIVDFVDRDIIPCCNYIYEEVISSIPGKIARKLIDPRYDDGNGFCDDDIILALDNITSDTRKNDDLDELQSIGINYGSVIKFKKLLNFIGCHNYMSPYNALLLYLQKPDSTFVFTTSVWRDGYERRPKCDARALLLQNSTGQLQCMYDYSETEIIPKTIYSLFDFDYELEDRWKKIQNDERKLTVDVEMRNLQLNLPVYGIFLDWTLKANDAFVGYTDVYYDKELTIRYDDGGRVFKYHSYIRMSVNYRYPEEEVFYFICCELARMFCTGSMYSHDGGVRKMSVKEREFETITVIWIVFRRLGLYNPFEDYLDVFCKDGKIPECSIEHVTDAADRLERMLTCVVKPQDSPLYKLDDVYRQIVDDMRR